MRRSRIFDRLLLLTRDWKQLNMETSISPFINCESNSRIRCSAHAHVTRRLQSDELALGAPA